MLFLKRLTFIQCNEQPHVKYVENNQCRKLTLNGIVDTDSSLTHEAIFSLLSFTTLNSKSLSCILSEDDNPFLGIRSSKKYPFKKFQWTKIINRPWNKIGQDIVSKLTSLPSFRSLSNIWWAPTSLQSFICLPSLRQETLFHDPDLFRFSFKLLTFSLAWN